MLELITEPLQYAFMWRGLAAAVIVGLVCAVVGCFVVLRGLAFFGAQLPFAGPRAAFGVGVGGLLLIGTGVALNTLLQHEWVVWTGLGLAAAALLVAGALMYANHHHSTQTSSP